MSGPTFADDVKALFREQDRDAMLHRFDLWSHADVSENAPAILEAVRSGTMPCDGPWGPENVELFKTWLDNGTPA
jgi:hypothetical protein